MRATFPLLVPAGRSLRRKLPKQPTTDAPIILIENATFYRKHRGPGQDPTSNPAIFPNLTFSLPAFSKPNEFWTISGRSSSGKTTLLEILQGKHFCTPAQARSFPFLTSLDILAKNPQYSSPARAIQYVGFNEQSGGLGGSGARGAYLSARYESRHEETDYSVMDYLKRRTQLNVLEEQDEPAVDHVQVSEVIEDLGLKDLVHRPMRNLSNGQIRRAKIARALLGKPELLLLDEPFVGLDPEAVQSISQLLHRMALAKSPRVVLALRQQDLLPRWITHLIHLGSNFEISYMGRKSRVRERDEKSITIPDLQRSQKALPEKNPSFDGDVSSSISPPELEGKAQPEASLTTHTRISREGLPFKDRVPPQIGEPLVEMRGVNVKYGDKQILGGWQQDVDGEMRNGLWWTIRRGQRWGIFGLNGSGKTTLLSLICSDHPQTYSLPILLFGQSRLPTPGSPGVSIFAIQSRIGHCSPEIHAFFPKHLSLRQVIENAWAETFLGTPKLTHDCDVRVDACLRWFEAELNPEKSENATLISSPRDSLRSPGRIPTKGIAPQELERDTDWADTLRFDDLPFSAQRIALFLRAIIKSPDLIILDEAFSGMDEAVRDKCMTFLTWGHTKVLAIRSMKRKLGRVLVNSRVVDWGRVVMRGLEERQALLCVSHVRDELPGVVREWIRLPGEGGNAVKFGRLEGPLEGKKGGWKKIWGDA